MAVSEFEGALWGFIVMVLGAVLVGFGDGALGLFAMFLGAYTLVLVLMSKERDGRES